MTQEFTYFKAPTQLLLRVELLEDYKENKQQINAEFRIQRALIQAEVYSSEVAKNQKQTTNHEEPKRNETKRNEEAAEENGEGEDSSASAARALMS